MTNDELASLFPAPALKTVESQDDSAQILCLTREIDSLSKRVSLLALLLRESQERGAFLANCNIDYRLENASLRDAIFDQIPDHPCQCKDKLLEVLRLHHERKEGT